jgi:hypothetical protein
LIATESATLEKLHQAVAEGQRFRAQLGSREADLARARARLGSTRAELEPQKRQSALLDSQELLLRADLTSKKASSHWRGPIWITRDLNARKRDRQRTQGA